MFIYGVKMYGLTDIIAEHRERTHGTSVIVVSAMNEHATKLTRQAGPCVKKIDSLQPDRLPVTCTIHIRRVTALADVALRDCGCCVGLFVWSSRNTRRVTALVRRYFVAGRAYVPSKRARQELNASSARDGAGSDARQRCGAAAMTVDEFCTTGQLTE